MRKAPLLVALSLLAASGPAVAQAPQPAPSEERSASPVAAPAPQLNLKLDDAARYTRETPRESGVEALPSLGANAQPMPTTPTPTTTRPFPTDTERGER